MPTDRLQRVSPFSPTRNGLNLAVRLTPKASRNAIDGIVTTVDGRSELKISVTAVPENGRANAALIKLLSKEWKIAKGRFEIVAGQTERHKTLTIAALDSQEELVRLEHLMREKG